MPHSLAQQGIRLVADDAEESGRGEPQAHRTRQGDARDLSNAITRLAANPQEAAAMGASGRRFVEAEFDRDKLAAAMLEVLRTVAA